MRAGIISFWAAVTAQTVMGAASANSDLPLRDLTDLSLDQLSNIVVTSASRHDQALSSAATSIYVITADDIRRSGAITLPQVLRLAPNLVVAQVGPTQYAISARGFNNPLANRMLVMIDGRIVYSPLFSGVFWEAQIVMLEDVARIEVISGPGSTLWGPNAVDGVINIITRRAGETQGALASLGDGTQQRQVAARYGGQLPNGGYYRVYGETQDFAHSELANGSPVPDASQRTQGGFRADWGSVGNGMTVQGDLYTATVDQAVGGARDLAGGNLMGSWYRQLPDLSGWRLQTYYDHVERSQPGAIWENLDNLDLDFQYTLAPHQGHRLMWGSTYRYSRDWLVNLAPENLAFIPASRNLSTYDAFLQDEWQLRKQLSLILGVKAEHEEFTGLEWLPSLRLAWSLREDHLLWAAVTRTVRAPSRIDRDVYIPGTPPYILTGSSNFVSEVAVVYELGYRAQPTARSSYSLSVYHYDNDRLRSYTPGGPFGNQLEGGSDGLEAWGSYQATVRWRLDGGWLEMRRHLHIKPGSASDVVAADLGNDPRRQVTLRSVLDIAQDYEFDVMARYVGELPNPQVPSYSAVDARFGWLVNKNWEVSLLVNNLFDPWHGEWGADATRAEFPRSIYLQVQWRS